MFKTGWEPCYLYVLVLSQKEAHPRACGGGGVLSRHQQTYQHPSNLIIIKVAAGPESS